MDDGSCFYDYYGCTNPSADNYDPSATIDDGSCYFSGTYGCTDPNAVNYNPWANYEDGSCYYYYYGCTDPSATNYDFNANFDDGSCYYDYYDCYGDLDGLAIVDDCGTCAGGNTGIQPCVLIGVNTISESANALEIFPNPSNGRFAISELEELGNSVVIQLLDATGRMVLRQTWNAHQGAVHMVDVTLENGVYLLHITTENGKRWNNTVVINAQ